MEPMQETTQKQKKTKAPPRVVININKIIVRVNVYLYRKSGGRILGHFGNLDALLLTTLGRSTGKSRTNPVGYMWDNGRFIICAAYGGEPVNPAWYKNLIATPKVNVEIGKEKIEVLAEVLAGSEREEIWAKMIEVFPLYAKFQDKTDRELPVVVLTPTS